MGYGPDDRVWLVYTIPSGLLWGGPMTRRHASDLLRQWYDERERVLKEEDTDGVSARWLIHGTLALNEHYHGDSQQETFARFAVAVKDIQAIDIREIERSSQTILAEAQRTIAEVMKKQAEDMKRGEDWRESGE